jgi:NodT family efflux transporter outer membrane factor (OMF) lipoprotein
MRPPLLLAPAMLLCLAGCKVGPNFTQPKPFAPSSWFAAAPAAPAAKQVSETAPDPAWWNILHDAELSSLEEKLAASNLDLRIAASRLAQSRAQASVTGAALFPTLTGSGSDTREKMSSEGVIGLFGGGSGFGSNGSIANGTSSTSNAPPGHGLSVPAFSLFQYGFDASWEADIWGRVRREKESAIAAQQESVESLRGALVSAEAELGNDYIMLRGTQASLSITRQNIASARKTLALTEERYKAGLTTELDTANAAALLANTEASLPALEKREAELINAISLLLGEGPQALRPELAAAATMPPLPPKAPIGVPGDLARRRPDIRAADAKLHEATADIGVALGDFYPSLTLDGSFGFQALHFSNIADWNAHQFGFGPSITLPIFEGGKLMATLDLRKAQQQEAAISYQQTVLRAWHDVDNALTAYQADQRQRDALKRAETQATKALDLSQQRYRQGVADFLNVLDAERQLFSAELSLADAQTAVGSDFVSLYKALGGGWEQVYPAQTCAKSSPLHALAATVAGRSCVNGA